MRKKQSSKGKDMPKGNKKRGRKRKKRAFEETRVGFLLQHEAPLEYELIINVSGTICAPSADLIESIGYASINPLFKKPKFRRALIEYRKHGLYVTPRKCRPETELFYIRMRQRNAQLALKQIE